MTVEGIQELCLPGKGGSTHAGSAFQITEQRAYWLLQAAGWGVYSSFTLFTTLVAPVDPERGNLIWRAALLCFCFTASLLLHSICKRFAGRPMLAASTFAQCIGSASLLGFAGGGLAHLAEITFAGSRACDAPLSCVLSGAATGGLLLTAWCALYLGIKHMQEADRNAERLRQAETLAQQAQLRALRYQLNPHFLFNALNATSTLVREGNANAATELISRLGGYLRTTLSEIDEAEAPLSREMEMAREYLEIERTRFGDRLSICIAVDPAAAHAYVPSLLLQPVIENAVRYGVAGSLEGGAVRISARRDGANVRIEVANSDSGTRFADQPKGFGIGLANTQLRLSALYGSRQSVDCRQNEDGFVVALLLPFHDKPAGLA